MLIPKGQGKEPEDRSYHDVDTFSVQLPANLFWDLSGSRITPKSCPHIQCGLSESWMSHPPRQRLHELSCPWPPEVQCSLVMRATGGIVIRLCGYLPTQVAFTTWAMRYGAIAELIFSPIQGSYHRVMRLNDAAVQRQANVRPSKGL